MPEAFVDTFDPGASVILQRGRIGQIAVVTSDFERTILDWVNLTGAGPFFCGTFNNENYLYRGQRSSCEVEVAFGYLQDMQIQIVAQLDDTPSIYTEILDAAGGKIAFHHLLLLTDDIDADLARYANMGIEPAAYMQLKGMRVAFMDTVQQAGTIIEFFQMSPYFEDFFARVHQSHLTWDGRDPIRRHPLG